MYVCDNHISWHYALDIAQRCSSIFILQQFSKDFCQSRSGQRISMSTPKDSRCQNEDLPNSVVFKKRISEEGYLLLKSIHYKTSAFRIFTPQKSNTFVEIAQNINGMAGI